jgi:hypothetical protein
VTTVDHDTLLSRREATLRSIATTCLAGIALVQAIELPSLFVQGTQIAVLSMGTMVLCLALGWALAGGPARAGTHLWRLVAAAGVVVLAGWAVPRLLPVPGLAHHRGHWTSMPGAAAGASAAVCLVLAAVAARPTRAAARGLAVAAAVVLAFGPATGALLVALGPGLSQGEASLAAGEHIHGSGIDESAIRFEPLAGGHTGRYVYTTRAPAQQTAFGIALVGAAALLFTWGAVGHLRRRSAPSPRVVLRGLLGLPA